LCLGGEIKNWPLVSSTYGLTPETNLHRINDQGRIVAVLEHCTLHKWVNEMYFCKTHFFAFCNNASS
jgi:hypothetical protein